MQPSVLIIGSGFSSLAAASYLAKAGFKVNVYEKNSSVGGRARRLHRDGFSFDMGPSWYWMPDIFERFFGDFNKNPEDYYHLDRLNPAYKIFFEDDSITIGDSMEAIGREFERIEPGSSKPLKKFIARAQEHYDIAINKIVYRPGLSPLELITTETATRVDQFFKTIHSSVRSLFKNPKLIATLEFPVLFLGAKPKNTPAFYSFMNFADFGLGTWHPKGGMYEVILGMKQLAEELGVIFHTDHPVDEIEVEGGKVKGVIIKGEKHTADVVLSGADYHHTETLLPKVYRQYSESYWDKRTFAPSTLLFYVGFDRKLDGILHHSLFFDTSFETHAEAIYDTLEWPENPLFYCSFPSRTDDTVAPEGKEAAVFLIPIAPGLKDTPEIREHYFDLILERFEKHYGSAVKNSIIFNESYCVNDFISDLNSYKGNAYGLANTLRQTAFLRPGLRSKKVNNLYFTGQLTVPGPGVPPSLISGKLVSELIVKRHKG